MTIIAQSSYSGSTGEVSSSVDDIRYVVSAACYLFESISCLTAFSFDGAIGGFLESYLNGNVLLVATYIVNAIYDNVESGKSIAFVLSDTGNCAVTSDTVILP